MIQLLLKAVFVKRDSVQTRKHAVKLCINICGFKNGDGVEFNEDVAVSEIRENKLRLHGFFLLFLQNS